MSLSTINIDAINTIPILSVAGVFAYTFEIPENARVQILWTQFTFTADATVGARRTFLQVRDETAALILSIGYFATQGPSTTVGITFIQGSTIIPATILGTITTIPADGLFVQNGWTLNIFPFPFISAGDVFSGNFQSRGLHNSGAPN